MNNFEKVAELCHELNRAYCSVMRGLDEQQLPWASAMDWQRESAIKGVEFALNNPDATPRNMHENWLKDKAADGWVYGEVKDPVAKTHPCFVPYDELPVAQQFKDDLFLLAVRQFATKESEVK